MRDELAVQMVIDRLSLADDQRTDYAMRAVENEMLYNNYIDETTHPYLSNIALPWPYIIVESYLGKCIQMLAAVLPYVRIVEEDDDSRPKAKMVEKDVNMAFYYQKWPIFSYKIYKQAFKLGTVFILEKPWGFLNGREMPIFQPMNFYRTWVNPSVLDLDDEDAYLIYETYIPMNAFKSYKGNPNYKNLSKIKEHEGDIKTTEEKEIQAFKNLSDVPYDKYSKLVKTHFYWSNDDFIVVTNDDNIIRNDNEHNEGQFLGRIPVRKITPIPLEDEFYGMSILEQGKGLFSEVDENRNQYNDAVNLMLNPQWIIDRNAGIKKTTITARAGNIVWTDDVAGITPMKVDWNILPQSIQRGKMIEMDIMNYSNAFPQLRGQQVSGTETATEYMGMRSAGELRSDTYNLLLSMMSIEQFAEDIVQFKRMFMTDSSKFYYWPEQKTNIVTPNDYTGNFTYKAFAGYKKEREIERKHMIEAMGFIFANQAFLPLVIPHANEWLDRLLDYFDFRSPEQLYVTDEEMKMQQQDQMMQMMSQMIAGGGQGGAGQPALGEREMRTPETTPNPGTMQLLGR
jgi:hypothetical protein